MKIEQERYNETGGIFNVKNHIKASGGIYCTAESFVPMARISDVHNFHYTPCLPTDKLRIILYNIL